MLPQYQETLFQVSSTLFCLRTDTPTLFISRYQAEITYSAQLSLSPCNARRSFHTLSPTPTVPGWVPLQPMPLSLSLSLCAPHGARPRIPGTARVHLSPDVVSVSCAASTPSTLVGHLLLRVPPATFPARPPHAWRACSTGACWQRGGARARPPASSGPYRVCCCRWESWRKAFWQ